METAALAEKNRPILLGNDREFFTGLGVKNGLKPFQGKDIFVWVYNRRELDPGRWTSLPASFRRTVAACFDAGLPAVEKESKSSDGTVKLLLRLDDGNGIEAVYIPAEERVTLCISSQAGCPVGCKFCLTGKNGFSRNLEPSEILAQMFILEEKFGLFGTSYNIVVMGMGEPLLNLANMRKALGIMMDAEGMALSRRRITVSTIGVKGKLQEYLADRALPPLAISLHSAIEEKRNALIPPSLTLPLGEIRKALQEASRKEREKISIEYVLLKDINDGDQDAMALAKFCKGLKVKVNLIPFNEHPSMPYEAPYQADVIRFQDILSDGNVSTTVRKSRGSDIFAACGQLAAPGERKKK